ncbi:MAG: hypothetical protein JWO03_1483 [Bacteroidetes bacterium]|nr:hypothetical protein [Bacteroidota bacterium]
MQIKLFNNMLLFSLFGIAMSFFGNLYEGIVIGPNMLQDSIHRMQYWQKFFVATNPAFFYVPVTQLAAIISVVLYFKTDKQKVALKKKLKLAAIFQIASIALSVYIITQINLKLFFGDLEKYRDAVSYMALLWNVLNAVRILLVGIALTFTFRAYVIAQNERPGA